MGEDRALGHIVRDRVRVVVTNCIYILLVSKTPTADLLWKLAPTLAYIDIVYFEFECVYESLFEE